jgi:pseudouridine-5'-phosphate glycosidase
MKREVVRLSEEVAQALAEGRPVVALESSVMVQGLPPPRNVEAAIACEQAIRELGAVPATTAFVAGVPVAGLTAEDRERLVDPATGARKIGARDAAAAVAFGHWGATTVSGTCAIADAVGIPLFATGGIGGVHREAEKTFDISQDLLAIARSRVAVVTAGAKAILDLPRTLEALETLAVPVVGFGTSELPAFYNNVSGLPLEHRVETAEALAQLLLARWDRLGEGGVIIANPVPEASQSSPEVIDRAIREALEAAAAQGVRGKAVTPFLLAEVAKRSAGESLETNLSLLLNNARLAARVAVALSAARRG